MVSVDVNITADRTKVNQNIIHQSETIVLDSGEESSAPHVSSYLPDLLSNDELEKINDSDPGKTANNYLSINFCLRNYESTYFMVL